MLAFNFTAVLGVSRLLNQIPATRGRDQTLAGRLSLFMRLQAREQQYGRSQYHRIMRILRW